jgi:hypothetical protein
LGLTIGGGVGDGEACSFCRDDLEPAGVALVV